MTTKTDAQRSAEVADLTNQYAYGTNLPTAHLAAVWEEIERLDLAGHVAEIDARGYTVIPPEKVAPAAFTERMRKVLLDVVERRTGRRPNVEGATEQGGTPFGYMAAYLLFEDPIFQQAALNPTAIALVDYYLGRSSILGLVQAFIKGPGGSELPLHTDNVMIPAPYPAYEQSINITWLLSDYDADNGATCFVPGSNRFGRPPEAGEMVDARVAAKGKAGSLLIWPGSTWHGGLVRKNPGLRLPVSMIYQRMYLQTQEPYAHDVTPETLARNPSRFATLMGQHQVYGYRSEGVDFVKAGALPGKSLWD
jgi:hypothetical protein